MKMNAMALNTVYNHLLTTNLPKKTTQFDTHKKSELRSTYNAIVKMNKESPLCILDTSKESQNYAVDLKENARYLRNTIASLGGLDQSTMLNKKMAISTNTNIASAAYIGDVTSQEDIPSFEIEVTQLASSQYNTGKYLPSSGMDLPKDAYSFDINIQDLNYEFQFNINENDTNLDVQKRLANLITNANIGVEGNVLEDGEGNSSLVITSKATGTPKEKDYIFQISDDKTSKSKGTVDYFGIGEITRPSCNAEFKINGNERSASSNNFTVEKLYELNLQGLSSTEGETATIGLKPDTESITENISHLIIGYNDFLKVAASYSQTQPKSLRLVSEMNAISNLYQNELGQIGLEFKEDGTIKINNDQLIDVASQNSNSDTFAPIKEFTNSLVKKTNQITINPMDYVAKTIVAYKNPGHNFSSPYITSAYSGMMFNSYC